MSAADTANAALNILAGALRKAHPDIAAELVRRAKGEQPRALVDMPANAYLLTFDEPDHVRHARVAAEIIGERVRQRTVEGYDDAHDDGHDNGAMALAAGCYAHMAGGHDDDRKAVIESGMVPRNWPWSRKWWKPKDRRSDLIRAGALILAEIERLDRAAAKL